MIGRREFISLLGASKPYDGKKNLLLYITSISSVFAIIASCGSPAKAHWSCCANCYPPRKYLACS
jgi:hypothetical protein